MLREADVLEKVRVRLGRRPAPPALRVPFGDDAAVLAGPEALVVTTDMLLDGVDCEVASCGYRAAGRKAMNKNLSDLAAMAARPLAAFVSLALPSPLSGGDVDALLDGLFDAADAAGCAIAGGDTKRSPGGLVVNVALLGDMAGLAPVTRAGARAGDLLCVTGALGGALLGRHLEFEPRLAAARRLAEHHGATAMVDLSDGLSTDLGHLCDASRLGAAVTAAALPVAEAARRLAARDGRPALDHALHDGEDYELLFTVPPAGRAALLADRAIGVPVTVVGAMTGPAAGVVLSHADGRRVPLAPGGFEHRFDGGAEPA